MKKRLLVLGLAFTMLAATACGTSSDNGSKTSKADKTVTAATNDDKKDDAKESYKSADDITMDDLKNHEETSADDFEYGDGPDGSVVIDGYTGDDPIVVIPNEIDGKKVVDFGKIFTNNKDVVAIKVGDNIENIKNGAFGNCDNLKYIVLGKNVKVFEHGNVGGKKFEQLELNDGLEQLGEEGTSGAVIILNKDKVEVKIPESVNHMAFTGAKTLIVKAGSYAESFAKEHNMDYRVE